MKYHFVFVCVLCVFLGSTVLAQVATKTCDGAESTADMIICTKSRHEHAQTALNNIFQKILDQHTEQNQSIDDLWRIQKGWLSYRDQECKQQMDAEENESLKQLTKLSCQAALTEQRTSILSLSFQEDDASQQSILPLWMNAVADDHPDVFWDYQNRLNEDMNCDDVPEDIMLGVLQDEETQQFKTAVVLAKTPEAGRPRFTFFSDWNTEENGEEVSSEQPDCFVQPSLSLSNENTISDQDVEKSQDHEDLAQKLCNKTLLVKTLDCSARLLYWDGQAYSVKSAPIK